jgi:hypothetical protein
MIYFLLIVVLGDAVMIESYLNLARVRDSQTGRED